MGNSSKTMYLQWPCKNLNYLHGERVQLFPQLEDCARNKAPDFSITGPTQELGSARKG